MEPEVKFFGAKIPSGAPSCACNCRPSLIYASNVQFSIHSIFPNAGKNVSICPDGNEDAFETIHIAQFALGDKPAKGPHTVFIENEGK